MTRTRNRHSGPAMTWLARVTVLALGAATLTVPLAVMTGAEAAGIQPRTTVPTTTLAVIKTIRVGSNPSGVAVNDQDDTATRSTWAIRSPSRNLMYNWPRN